MFSVFLGSAIINNETLTKEINSQWEKDAPIAFLYERDTDASKSISKELKTFYLHDKPVDKTQLTPLAQVCSFSYLAYTRCPKRKLLKYIS